MGADRVAPGEFPVERGVILGHGRNRAHRLGPGLEDQLAVAGLVAGGDDDGIDIDVLSELVERAAHLITVCRGRISAAQQRVAGIVETLETSDPY